MDEADDSSANKYNRNTTKRALIDIENEERKHNKKYVDSLTKQHG